MVWNISCFSLIQKLKLGEMLGFLAFTSSYASSNDFSIVCIKYATVTVEDVYSFGFLWVVVVYKFWTNETFFIPRGNNRDSSSVFMMA